MTRKSTPLDIYFHMVNHYRKLQVVKSVVDTSAPIGYYERLQGGRQSRPPSRAEKRREMVSSDRPTDRSKLIVKHDCLCKEENPPTRSQSLPPRPPTRRKPADMPIPKQPSTRARSSGPGTRRNSTQKSRSARSQRSGKCTPPVFAHFSTSIKPHSTQPQADYIKTSEKLPTAPTPAPRNAKPKQRDTSFKNSISDHEYLQFSLRITEDIIRNDLYTNKEMRRVFNSHLEANRGRLDMEKMTQQIDNLCMELNIPLHESQDDDQTSRSKKKHDRNNVSCICAPRSQSLNVELKDCECGSTRCLPFECVQHCGNDVQSIGNSTNYSVSLSTTPTSRETVKNTVDEDGTGALSDDIPVYENPSSTPVTPVILSAVLLTPGESEVDNAIPYYEEVGMASHVRPSLGFLQLPLLPSLSRVTEKTEPTTSSETMNTKLEIAERNVESSSEFDASDVLPVIEHLDYDQITVADAISLSKSPRKKNIDETHKKIHDNSEPSVEENNRECFDSTQSKDNNFTKMEYANISDQVPSSSNTSNILWVVCPSSKVSQPIYKDKEKLSNTNAAIQQSLKSLPASEPQIRTVYCAPPTHSTQSACNSFTTQQVILEAKSEPIQQIEKLPVPAPRSCTLGSHKVDRLSFETRPSLEQAFYKDLETNNGNKNACSYSNKDNSKSVNEQHSDRFSNKIHRLSNEEEEFILVPGPIYVPKSSMIPLKFSRKLDVPILAPKPEKRDICCTLSKDVMVNSDEHSCSKSNCSKKVKQMQSTTSSKVVREPSFTSNLSPSMKSTQSALSDSSTLMDLQSESVTYSQIHNPAANVVHTTSFASGISRISNMPPQTIPISESMLNSPKVRKNIAKPPKVLTKHIDHGSATQANTSENNALILFNDYDLTPQRDCNNGSAYSNPKNTLQHTESEPFSYKDKFTVLNKEALLLGDEYEIKNDFITNKASISSCYDNGLPYNICRFYPNISTQTSVSDFISPAALPEKTIPLIEQPQVEEPKQESVNNDESLMEKKHSILKKKLITATDGDTLKQLEKQRELQRQRQLEKQRELDKQIELEKQRELEQQRELAKQKEKEYKKHDELGKLREFDKQQEQLHALEKPFNESHRSSSLQSFSKKPQSESFSELLQTNDGEINEPDNQSQQSYSSEEEERVYDAEDAAEHEINEDEENGKKHEDENEENNEVFEDGGEENNNGEEDDEEEDEEDDVLEALDNAPNFTHRASIMMTIKQVTNDLEKFRKTEIPVEEFVQTRYNIPMQNRTLTVADDLIEQQARSLEKKDSRTSNVSTAVSNMGGSASKFPFIEVTSSEPQLEIKKATDSELDTTSCCGLKRGKKKPRRDILTVDESIRKMPNISSIPDDQLFEMQPRRRTMESSGYGNERKSLRFDYSAMKDFSGRRETLDIKDFTSSYSAEQSLANLTPMESDDMLPAVRNPVVSYRTPSLPDQSKDDDDNVSVISAVQFDSNVRTIKHEIGNSIVDILQPQQVGSEISVQELDQSENETTNRKHSS